MFSTKLHKALGCQSTRVPNAHTPHVQDLLVKLSEVLVGTSVVAAVNGPPSLAELASSCMVAVVMSGSSSGGGGSAGASSQAPVLQALMPVILMTAGKGDVPIRFVDANVVGWGRMQMRLG